MMSDISEELAFVEVMDWLQAEAHRNAVEKGFYLEPPTFGDQIALVHSELSEALECWRDGMGPVGIQREGDKPVGIGVELADAVIRIADMAQTWGIELGPAILEKMKYNRGRPIRHGRARL
jgi:hypothetical protein